MKRYVCTMLALASAALFAAPAAAAPPTGTRVDLSVPGLSGVHAPMRNESARQGINAFLRCSASIDRPRAVKVLKLAYRSPEQIEAANKFIPRYQYSESGRADCFSRLGNVELGYDPVVAVGTISEFFILNGFDANDVDRITQITADQWQEPELTPSNSSEAFGMCVAQAQPQMIYDLVRSVPDSQDENTAVRQLVPMLGQCLTDGFEANFDVPGLRSVLAFGLYRTLEGASSVRRAAG